MTAAERACPACGASEQEIRATGHRRQGGRACVEACSCRPEHFSLKEHHLVAPAPDAATVTLAVAELEMLAREMEESAKRYEEQAQVARVRATAARAGAWALLQGGIGGAS